MGGVVGIPFGALGVEPVGGGGVVPDRAVVRTIAGSEAALPTAMLSPAVYTVAAMGGCVRVHTRRVMTSEQITAVAARHLFGAAAQMEAIGRVVEASHGTIWGDVEEGDGYTPGRLTLVSPLVDRECVVVDLLEVGLVERYLYANDDACVVHGPFAVVLPPGRSLFLWVADWVMMLRPDAPCHSVTLSAKVSR